jgi:hypothetical protein
MNAGPRDRRPWLILSRSESLALYSVANQALEWMSLEEVPRDLARALRMIEHQVAWIDHGSALTRPSIDAALKREARARR